MVHRQSMKHENCGVPLALSSQKCFQVCISMDMSNQHHHLGVQLSQAHLIALKMRASQEKKKESECTWQYLPIMYIHFVTSYNSCTETRHSVSISNREFNRSSLILGAKLQFCDPERVSAPATQSQTNLPGKPETQIQNIKAICTEHPEQAGEQ